MTVYFNLTVDGSYVDEYTLTSQANGSSPSWIIDSSNYVKGDNVSCNITLFDGSEFSDTNSTSLTILNSVPSIDSYNSTSKNRSLTYTDDDVVEFE